MPIFTPGQRSHEPVVLDLPVYDIGHDTWSNIEFRAKQMLPPRTVLEMQETDSDGLSLETLVEYWAAVLIPESAEVMADILTGDNRGIDLKVLTDAFEWILGQLGAGDNDDPSLPPD